MIYYIAAWFFVISMQIEGENQASGLIMRPCHSTSGSGKKEKKQVKTRKKSLQFSDLGVYCIHKGEKVKFQTLILFLL
jgi:hypothetical protein